MLFEFKSSVYYIHNNQIQVYMCGHHAAAFISAVFEPVNLFIKVNFSLLKHTYTRLCCSYIHVEYTFFCYLLYIEVKQLLMFSFVSFFFISFL